MNRNIPFDRYTPFTQLTMVICLSFGFMTTIGSGISWVIMYLYSGDAGFFNTLLMGDLQFKEEHVIPLLLIQGTVSTTGFIVFPLLWCRYVWRFKYQQIVFGDSKFSSICWILLLLCITALIVINLPITEWNKNITFPKSWEDVEFFFKKLEQQAEKQILVFTSFNSHLQFYLSLIILSLIPAIGEEFLFRGIIQPIGIKLTRNKHIGILLSALLFSAFHLQFYGFFPRLVFGIFFGYLYYHTRSLLPSIVCHFFNNAITLTLIYLFKIGIFSSNYANETEIPLQFILMMLILFFISGYFYVHLVNKKKIKKML